MRRIAFTTWCVLALAGSAVSCRAREASPAGEGGDGGEQGAPVLREFSFDGKRQLLFIYADLAGRFQTATALAEIPEGSRKVVRVLDPKTRGGPASIYDRVHVADLTHPGERGDFVAVPVPRAEFELRALAALPPGVGSRVTVPMQPGGDAPAIKPHGDVILYGASWCGACKQARAFLEQQHVSFAERDIERDPSAARELAAKAAAAGIPADRIPIIDVRGRLVVGFDQARLTTLLGEET